MKVLYFLLTYATWIYLGYSLMSDYNIIGGIIA